ncbi:hypothetical protein DSECCO2_557590 [anaerobic digester metagenome]
MKANPITVIYDLESLISSMTAANISIWPVILTVTPAGGLFHTTSSCIFLTWSRATLISISTVENSSTASRFPLR